uniref:Uncharacterized protein n=1 Tax=Pectobacterium carotovorum TaxID=554 RepID=A0A0K0MPB2_PECCA|nr:hypothetical protein [Pectobacterium carotovorum]AKG47448.1 hypothetical protein pA_00008 [Pectobacterium carotovorum]
MNLLKEQAQADLYYASSKTEAGDKVAEITLQIVNGENRNEIFATTFRRITDKSRKQSFELGAVRIEQGGDEFSMAVYDHFRVGVDNHFKTLMSEVTDFLETGLDTSTWIGAYGLKVFSEQPAAIVLPESVLGKLEASLPEVTE